MENKEVVYLCRRDCCPSMTYDRSRDMLEITDDFGGRVTISTDDFRRLAESFFNHFSKEEYNA